jgi:putative flippase GtrA
MQLVSQFSRFVLAGGLAAAANYSSRFLFSMFLPYLPSITLAFIVGLITGFLMMRTFVFLNGTAAPARQAGYYIIVNLVGLVLTLAVSFAVARLMANIVPDRKLDEAIGHLFGVVSPVVLSFYAHKKLTFR